MWPFSLNNKLFSDYGIIEGQSSGSNLAITGAWDMPFRIGKIYHEWPDEDGVEPYLRADELFYGGRDIVFNGFIEVNSKVEALEMVNSFFDDVDAFNGHLVPLESELGTWQVYVKSDVKIEYDYQSLCLVEFVFRQPVVDLSGVVPAASEGSYLIDNIPFERLGFERLAFIDDLNRPSLKEQTFTVYGKEGYQGTKRGLKELKLHGYIKKASYSEFIDVIQGLYALFSSPGARTLVMPDGTYREFFIKDGFQITNLTVNDDDIFALLDIQISEIRQMENWNLLTNSTGLILVDQYGKPLTEIIKGF